MSTDLNEVRNPAHGRQTLSTVLRAEISRLLAPGGVRPWLIVATAFAMAMSILTVLLSTIDEVQSFAQFDVAGLISSGPMIMLVVLALGVTTQTAREVGDGTVLTSKTMVPRDALLFTARLLAWVVITLVLGTALCLASSVLALIPAGLESSSVSAIVASVFTSLLLSLAIVMLFAAGTALLQRGAVIVFVGMLLLVVLPIAFSVAGALLGGTWGGVLAAVGRSLPGALLFTALQPPTSAPEIEWSSWTWAILGVVAWTFVTGALALRQFRRPGYGDH